MAKLKIRPMPLFDPLDELQKEAHAPRKHLRLVIGEQLKEEGMQKAVDATPPSYRTLLENALLNFHVGTRLTVERLTAIAGRPPEGHYNAVGGIISGMAKRGLIRKTGRMVKAERPGMHATELAEWEIVSFA